MNTEKEAKPKRPLWINPFGRGQSSFGRLMRGLALLVVLYLISIPVICWYEYDRAFPESFNPVAPYKEAKTEPAAGVVFSQTMIVMGKQMLDSWLPNDVVYPAVFLDNPQNFQLGQLEVIRYCTRVLRDKLSRQRTTDKIDPHAEDAFTAFSNDPLLWIFPSAESKIEEGVESLMDYQRGLKRGTSHFYPRADNLVELLDQLTSLLGGVNTRLANAPRDSVQRTSLETAGDAYSQGEQTMLIKVPWNKIDDNFYFARGVSYALREMMMAVKWEFKGILEIKRSQELMDNVIEELALANFEPLLVLNGSRDSIFANHSLKLMATLENVRQKLINLQHMLEK